MFLLFAFCKAESNYIEITFLDDQQCFVSSEKVAASEFEALIFDDKQPNPILVLFKKKQRLNKKITAAVLAFPFPFGMVGLHRIYLGTKPYVPVAYIASLGGVFGILPFIDFCAIAFDKDFNYYKDNGKVFMWVRE